MRQANGRDLGKKRLGRHKRVMGWKEGRNKGRMVGKIERRKEGKRKR